MKKKVRMLVSIAGLGDLQSKDAQVKYARIRRDMESRYRVSNGSRIRVFTGEQVDAKIAELKRIDDKEPRRGFAQDFSFKAGDEPVIDAKVAEKWEEAGFCVEIESEPAKKAA